MRKIKALLFLAIRFLPLLGAEKAPLSLLEHHYYFGCVDEVGYISLYNAVGCVD